MKSLDDRKLPMKDLIDSATEDGISLPSGTGAGTYVLIIVQIRPCAEAERSVIKLVLSFPELMHAG